MSKERFKVGDSVEVAGPIKEHGEIKQVHPKTKRATIKLPSLPFCINIKLSQLKLLKKGEGK
jgi:transcription antitermination factor NusG